MPLLVISLRDASCLNKCSCYLVIASESVYSYSYWIGLDSLADLGTYTWLSGRFLGQFAPWKIGQEQYTKGKCVAMVTDAQQGIKWELRDCDQRLPYICQYPPGGRKCSN